MIVHLIGTKESISELLQSLMSKGPSYGLCLNLKRCKILWPSGHQTFPEIDSEIKQIHTSLHGAELLGSPIVGSKNSLPSISVIMWIRF